MGLRNVKYFKLFGLHLVNLILKSRWFSSFLLLPWILNLSFQNMSKCNFNPKIFLTNLYLEYFKLQFLHNISRIKEHAECWCWVRGWLGHGLRMLIKIKSPFAPAPDPVLSRPSPATPDLCLNMMISAVLKLLGLSPKYHESNVRVGPSYWCA